MDGRLKKRYGITKCNIYLQITGNGRCKRPTGGSSLQTRTSGGINAS